MQHLRFRMRIGLDCRLYSESGVGRYVRNLIEQLLVIDRKNSYFLFVLSRDKEDVKYQISNIKKNWKLEIRNWKLITADIRWHTLEEQLKFPSIINKENLDLMHFPYFSVPIFYNKPFIVTIHDLLLHHFPTGLASTLPHWLYKLKLIGYKFVISKIAKKAKKIITVSQATKKEIVDHLGVDSNKIVVTYEGVDDKIRNPNIGIRNGFGKLTILSLSKDKSKIINTKTSADKYFLYVGNAYPHKNLERLIEAFTNIRMHANDLKLVLVGKEDFFYKRLKKKVKNMNLEKSVRFLGEVSDEELTSLYRNALALVVPSLMEGFGLPALEAMANKCLVLASDIPALREICGDVSVYFNPYSVEEIAQEMITVFHSNDTYHYSDRIKKGFERTKIFSWEKMARETLRIYESCIGRQPQHQVSQ